MQTAAPRLTVPRLVSAAVLVFLALVPLYAFATDQPYYVRLFARILIFALAALSLAPTLSYGGMISFGHALYLGIGAYAVGLLSYYSIDNGWMHLGVALVCAGVTSALTGAVCLRTTGLGFLMITFAFGQMFYFLVVSLKTYGGDEGLSIDSTSDFGTWLSLNRVTTLYYVTFVILIATLFFFDRLVNSEFGLILRGCKSNERRIRALGISPFWYKLSAYVISAMVCSVAGVLLANLTKFATPEYMSWIRSGDLIVMIILGGVNSLMGGVVGAVVLLLLEELSSSWTQHWMLAIGLFIVVMTLWARQGVYGSLFARSARTKP
jgi:branched-chain amino acid transport system permease protein